MENQNNQNLEQLTKIKSYIESGNHFLVTTHIRSDGDSIASVLLFASILRFLKKQCCILLDDVVPIKLNFLSGFHEIQNCKKESPKFIPECVIVVDCSNLERIGCVKEYITKDMVVINVDHHPGNQCFGHYNLVESKESSTVEIIYKLYSMIKDGFPTPDEATIIYTGIISDTGKFVFPNTTHSSLSICSEMVKLGAKPDQIASKLYCRNTSETLKTLATALSTLEFYYDGAVSCIHLNHSDIDSNGKVDTEGFVDYLLTIENTEVVFFMLEEAKDCYRVSFRSKEKVDVNAISKHFGGGGHIRASGCCIHGKLDDVKKKILYQLKNYI